MVIKKSIDRPLELTYKTMLKLADAIQHNSTIKEVRRFAGIRRNTYIAT
jgi:hypothetical protein